MATESLKKTILSFMTAWLENGDGQSWEDLSDDELTSRFNALKFSLQNHEETVQQNRDLQKELQKANGKIEELESKPFFPYQMNDGRRTDFGEFVLISHAWFTITNFPVQLGIVEVEWKNSNKRKMYLGVGVSGGKDFSKDVVSIAFYGQKIKETEI